MKTATRALIIASVLGVGCSGETGEGDSKPGLMTVTNPTGGATGVVTPPGTGGGVVTPPGTGGGSVTPPAGGSGSAPVVVLPPPSNCVKGVPPTTQIPRMTVAQYDGAMRDLLGVTAVDGETPSEALGIGDNTGSMTATEWNQYQLTGAKIAKSVIGGMNKAKFISCDATMPTCLDMTVKAFGKKAFRRPLTDDEVKGFVGFGDLMPKGTSDQIATAVLNAFLVSPSFLLMPELATDKDAAGNYKLTSYEVATRLATMIWNSIPDDTLLGAAEKNELGTKELVLAQAKRMIADKTKVGPLFRDFHRFYAEIRKEDGHWNRNGQTHDSKVYTKWTSQEVIGPVMMAEVDAFFSEVGANGTFSDLFLSPKAYVTKATAPIYGLDPSKYTDALTPVDLDPATRPGFLTRIGFLSSFSRFDSTSPILRGAFIGQRMLGAAPVPPKAGVPSEPPAGTYKTMREKVDALTKPDECKGCHHAAINPPGYVMEAFDSIGELQTVDKLGGPIDTKATVQVDDKEMMLSTPLELMQAITTGTKGKELYAERWVQFATRRSPNGNDKCDVDAFGLKLANNGYKIADLLADLSQTDSFSGRVIQP